MSDLFNKVRHDGICMTHVWDNLVISIYNCKSLINRLHRSTQSTLAQRRPPFL